MIIKNKRLNKLPLSVLIGVLSVSMVFPAKIWGAKAIGPVFPKHRQTNIGVVVRDLTSGEDIVSLNADKMLTPASILKCVTAASVFLAEKKDSCFYTVVSTEGEIDSSGTLAGNIVIKATGDPTLGSQFFPETAFFTDTVVSRLSQMGINHIAGSIEIDSVAFRQQGPGPMWELSDLGYSYGTGLYALNWNDNTRGPRSVAEPPEEYVDLLELRLKGGNIAVDWEDYENLKGTGKPFYTHVSPTAREIMRPMMEQSINMFAESMLRFLAPRGFTRSALDREMRLLSDAGLDTGQLNAYDGSGLTRASTVTPNFMADMLQTMAYRPDWAEYVALFPKVGSEGTVKKLLAGTRLQDRLVLKSGSMKGVQCFAGYMLNSVGVPTHAVVIMVNGFTTPRAGVRKGIEQFLLKELPE